jgi:hypothetical protein
LRSRRFLLLGLALLGALALAALALALLDRRPEPPPAGPERARAAPYRAPKGYVCVRASGPIVIDGKLDDDAWKDAPWTDAFVDIEGGRKPAPPYRTRVKMLWDDECLYIGAELEEPHVWATLTKHDSYIFKDDNDFEVFLDPDGDNHLYVELEMNALNTTWDLLLTMPYKDGGQALDAWEIAGLRTGVHVEGTLNDASDRDRGWTLEIAWPWRGLRELTKRRVPPQDGDQWRINFSRVEWEHEVVGGKYRQVPNRPEANWVWSPQGVVNMHRPERWGYLQFSTSPPGKADFVPDPAGPARHLLHEIYYAQRDYREKHQAWATDLGQLGLAGLSHPSLDGAFRLETTASLFEASVSVRRPGADPQRWRIRQDSHVWADPTEPAEKR